jgi:hypothetical protein
MQNSQMKWLSFVRAQINFDRNEAGDKKKLAKPPAKYFMPHAILKFLPVPVTDAMPLGSHRRQIDS